MEFEERVEKIAREIELGMKCRLVIGMENADRVYFQIECERPDTFTGEMGVGRGGKAYLSRHATDSELVQIAFGLYKGYWEHEAREGFVWRGRRVFGPHIATEALWEASIHTDARKPVPHGQDI